MTDFEPGRFTAALKKGTSNENHASLCKLKRGELYKFCKHHKLEVTPITKKAELFSIALYFLVDCEYVDESVLDDEEEVTVRQDIDPVALAKAKAIEIEANAKATEAAAKAKALEIEANAKLAQIPNEATRLEIEKIKAPKLAEGHPVASTLPTFDPTRHVRMVPSFQETLKVSSRPSNKMRAHCPGQGSIGCCC